MKDDPGAGSEDMQTQTRPPWILLPENRAARQAVERVCDCVCNHDSPSLPGSINPLVLHGPPGTGKTRLVNDLVAEATRRLPDLFVALLPASEFPARDDEDDQQALRRANLVIVEDLQHLSPRSVESVVGLIDRCLARRRQMVFTAGVGPAHLNHLSVRLTSRLAQGLVVGLEAFSAASRQEYLRQRLAARRLDLSAEMIVFLARSNSGSARQLEGILTRLEQVVASLDRPLALDDLAGLFADEAAARRPSLERIVQRVGGYFRVEPRRLCSSGRSREVLLPRQISMYLARRLTDLSLEQIGAYFGGRDHSTVLHACRKVERALAHDAGLGGAVRQLHADLE
jgi:chromosomal replication initiator protein